MRYESRAKAIGLTTKQGREHIKDADLLISDLQQGNSEIRSYDAEALGRIKDARAVDILIQAHQDNDPWALVDVQ